MKRVFLLLFLFIPQQSYSRTLSQLISDVRTKGRDPSGSRQRFSDTQITQWLNEAQRIANAQTWCLETSIQFQLSLNTTYYALPTDFLAVRRVTRNLLLLNEQSPASLDSKSEGWEGATGTPTYYFVNFASSSLLGFAPYPSVASDTGTIKLDYFQQTTDLVNGTDVPFNNMIQLYPYHPSLTYYAVSQVEAVDGEMTASIEDMKEFQAWVAIMANKCNLKPNYMPSASGRQ